MKLSTGMKKALSMFLTAALVVSGVYVSDGKASAKEQVLAVTAGTTNSIKVETNVKVATGAEITFQNLQLSQALNLLVQQQTVLLQ